MNEFYLGFLALIALLIPAVYAFLQMLGGRDKNALGISARVWGRIIAPSMLALAIMGLSLAAHTFHWWYLLSTPAYIASTHMGYGGDTLWKKILRRSIWSFTRTTCSLVFALSSGAWTLFLVQCTVGLVITLAIGTTSVLKAPQEESLINFCSVLFVPFMVL